jgi:mono/diheme cytochrome c family protein
VKVVISPALLGRYLTLAIPVLLMAGCDTSGKYPADLKYPLRTDPLVIERPKNEEPNPIPPGRLEQSILAIKEKGGTLLYPKDLEKLELADPKDPKKKLDVPRELTRALRKCFGTPAQPLVQMLPDHPDADAVDGQAEALQLSPKTLEAGSRLYRRHCLHCHGLAGDGRGPTGPWVSPPPRDYRRGVYKFRSTSIAGDKPTRGDLHRTLHNGLDGTTMPSFALIPEQDVEQLISYVIHLSLRGQVEYITMKTLLNKDDLADDSIMGQVQASLKQYIQEWDNARKYEVDPKTTPTYATREDRLAAIGRGYKLYIQETESAPGKNDALVCRTCHIDFGRQVPYKYDEWGTLVKPNNLTAGVYRAGRRPIDLFWRVKIGINPSGMPRTENLSDDQVWDLVAFLEALPYPEMLPPAVKERVYPPSRGPEGHGPKAEGHAAR